jgi:putative nucleotidyltransferase with HDIG domain
MLWEILSMGYTQQAEALLREWVSSEQLRKHCLAVAASMHYFAERYGEDVDLWRAVGILHDLDYERYPMMPDAGALAMASARLIIDTVPETAPLMMHPYVGTTMLRRAGWSTDVCRAILSHADYTGIERQTALERVLAAVDELSSFIIAVAMVRPNRSIHEVDAPAVRRKMKDKAFARAVHREDIVRGAELLDLELDALITEVIAALRADAVRLGVDGTGA